MDYDIITEGNCFTRTDVRKGKLRMEEREIDLLDMIVDILSHWRGILVALIVGAVLMGGISYAKSYHSIQAAQSAEEVILDKTAVEKSLAELEDTMTDSDKAAVLTTLDDEREYFYKEKYVRESVYMQLDPLNIAQTELAYKVQAEDDLLAQQLGAVYENLIDSVGMYDWVEQQTGVPSAYVGDLITVRTNSRITLTDNDKKVTLEGNFECDSLKVTIMQADTDACRELTDAVKSYIGQQKENLSTEVGNHSLILVSETSGIVMNTDVMDDQVEYRKDISEARKEITSAKADFSEHQKQYYNMLTWEETEEPELNQKDTTEEQPVVASLSVSKKYLLLGAVLFAFAYAGVLALIYIFNSRLRATDELQNLYHIPQMGVVVKDSGKKFIVDRWIDDLRHYGKRKFSAEQSMELAFAAVKIAAAKNGMNNICLMGCNLAAGAGNVCESLKATLEKEAIAVTVLDNVLYNAETMEKIDQVTGVVLVEKAGSTLYNEITRELELLKRQEIAVLGGIVVE